MRTNLLSLPPLSLPNDASSEGAEQWVKSRLPLSPCLEGLSSAERLAILISSTASSHHDFCQVNNDPFGCQDVVLSSNIYSKLAPQNESLVIL